MRLNKKPRLAASTVRAVNGKFGIPSDKLISVNKFIIYANTPAPKSTFQLECKEANQRLVHKNGI